MDVYVTESARDSNEYEWVLHDEQETFTSLVEVKASLRVQPIADSPPRRRYLFHIRVRAAVHVAHARVRRPSKRTFPTPRELTVELVAQPQLSVQLIDARPLSRVETHRAITNHSSVRNASSMFAAPDAEFDMAAWTMTFFDKTLPSSGAAPAWDMYATLVDAAPNARPLLFDLRVGQLCRRTMWQTLRHQSDYVHWRPLQMVIPTTTTNSDDGVEVV